MVRHIIQEFFWQIKTNLEEKVIVDVLQLEAMRKIQKLSDEELIEDVRSNDPELYREIVMRYQEKIFQLDL